MRMCRSGHKIYSDTDICPVCGANVIDLDATRAKAAEIQSKYSESENLSKLGKFMKAVSTATMKMCDILEKKAK